MTELYDKISELKDMFYEIKQMIKTLTIICYYYIYINDY